MQCTHCNANCRKKQSGDVGPGSSILHNKGARTVLEMQKLMQRTTIQSDAENATICNTSHLKI